jgi:hypothetical protein
VIEHWRRATPAQKLERLCAMGHSINELARADLRAGSRQPPDARSIFDYGRAASIATR